MPEPITPSLKDAHAVKGERNVRDIVRTIHLIQEKCSYIGQEFVVSAAKLRAFGLSDEDIARVLCLTAVKG